MSSATNYLENEVLDHTLATGSYTAPASVYVALFTANPGEAGSQTSEVSGGSYARQIAPFDVAVAGSATTNATITFPTATANWGTITHIAIIDAASAGNMLYYGPVTTSKIIETGDTFQITSGNLTVSLD